MGENGYIFYSGGTGPQEEIFISKEEYDKIPLMREIVYKLHYVEEMFLMLTNSLLDFNQTLFRLASEYFASRRLKNHVSSMSRVAINQAALNYLSTLNMYLEYLYPHKDKPGDFKVDVALRDDARIGAAQGLRNFIQHSRCFPLTLKYPQALCGDGISLSSLVVLIELDSMNIENDSRIGKGTREKLLKLRANGEKADAYEILNSSYEAVREIHKSVRESELYASDGGAAIKFLRNYISNYVEKNVFYVRCANDRDKLGCCGTIPYGGDRHIEFIDYMSKTYRCDKTTTKNYITNAPEAFVTRIAKRDFTACLAERNSRGS